MDAWQLLNQITRRLSIQCKRNVLKIGSSTFQSNNIRRNVPVHLGKYVGFSYNQREEYSNSSYTTDFKKILKYASISLVSIFGLKVATCDSNSNIDECQESSKREFAETSLYDHEHFIESDFDNGLYLYESIDENECRKGSIEKKGSSDKRNKEQWQFETENQYKGQPYVITMKEAIECSRGVLKRKIFEEGLPGISVEVSINGQIVWSEGYGYSDVENYVKCVPTSVMRIASISKALTMTAVAKLMEEGKLDIDAPIQKYVKNFPIKSYGGKEVNITTRQLLSHTSGIRHYTLKHPKKPKIQNKEIESTEEDTTNLTDSQKAERKRIYFKTLLGELALPPSKEKKTHKEYDLQEFYFKEQFQSLDGALELFKNDDLLFEPGTKYGYTTHGWTVVSAVIEGASGETFEKVMKKLFIDLNLHQTYFETHDLLIHKRARQYTRTRNSGMRNAPYVNNSYKYAGGGFLSTVRDLTNFGAVMLYSIQQPDNVKEARQQGFLKKSTMKEIWKPTPAAVVGNLTNSKYGLGWFIQENVDTQAFTAEKFFSATHTGSAVGGSSILMIAPHEDPFSETVVHDAPQGIIITILTNVDNVNLSGLANFIVETFRRVEANSKVVGTFGISKSNVYTVVNS